MTDHKDPPCTTPARHTLHICQIKARGQSGELAARTDNPGFICHNCNALANRAEDLCNGSPLLRKP